MWPVPRGATRKAASMTDIALHEPVADYDDGMPQRVVPHAIPAEQATLGAMMLSPQAADDIIEIVGSRDFYDPRNGVVFATIVAQLAAGHPVDGITLANALDEVGQLGTGSGKVPIEYLHTLEAAVPVAASGSYYARIVARKAMLRRLVEVGTRVAEIGYGAESSGRSAEDAVELAQRALHEATAADVTTDLGPVGHWVDEVVEDLEAVVAGRKARGISTGLGILDDLIGGWQPGQLVIPAGRPGMGKSAAALQFAKAAARRGHTVFVFSVEMSRGELVNRLLSDAAEVDLARFTNGRLDARDLTRIRGARDEIAKWPLHIYDTFRTVPMIRAASRRLAQRYGTPGLIVVDYLQRLSSDRRVDRRDLEVGEFARALKTLAQELGTTVIAPSQLNRGSEGRSDRRPQLSDLRESGELEQEADIVILLHRDDYYDRECQRAGEADFIVAKHRNGPTDTVSVAAQLSYSRFVDWNLPGGPQR